MYNAMRIRTVITENILLCAKFWHVYLRTQIHFCFNHKVNNKINVCRETLTKAFGRYRKSHPVQ